MTDGDDLTRAAATPSSHRTIGAYRLIDKLGEGGMGEVWRAEQSTPFRRTVAIKLIKAGMDTSAVVARFESERQALALMAHPNIASVFDAGSTPDGRPFFAMEYVAGTPITTFCDRQRLSVRQRLALFIQVCDGVQHAHQKAIIHRDLKPSNVLIALHDDKPVPKIIDFGLAKATAQRLTEKSMFTEVGVMVGTPAYMSPEQADLTERHVDTRTDVYALGVILYELLVGALPVDDRTLREAGFQEMLRLIQEREPPRPSVKLRAMGEASSASAGHRQQDVRTLARRLHGDLDWITMKALEKDRTRRYGSASDLAADLERHLRDEPVLAGPPSPTYRARKFVRRHRVGVSVASAAIVLLVAFAITSVVQERRIARERDRANQEAAASQRVADFMVNMFKVSDPSEARGNTVTAREILDKASHDIGTNLEKDPLLQARLMDTMGNVYKSLGLFPQAKALLGQALDIRRRLLGNDQADTVDTMRALAGLMTDNGDPGAEALDRQVLAIDQRVLGPKAPETLKALNNVATAVSKRGAFEQAAQMYREVLAGANVTWGEGSFQAVRITGNLVFALNGAGKYREAEAVGRHALEIARRTLGTDHPDTLSLMNNLAVSLEHQGKIDEKTTLEEEALNDSRRVNGPRHPDTLLLATNVAALHLDAGRLAEAESELKSVLAIEEQVLGTDNSTMALTRYDLARVEAVQGHRTEALSLLRTAVEHGLDPSFVHEIDGTFPSLRTDPSFAPIKAELGRRYEPDQKAAAPNAGG
ncbi:MAG TPA: serine/threonine-protein kinase [Vicinamibacterales bacterium]|nr:serine/threonine-protein kinase [Vicinamibacterales bacterium]